MCLTLLLGSGWEILGGNEMLEKGGGRRSMCRPVSAKLAKLALVVPWDSPNTTCSIFPALPKTAQLGGRKSNLSPSFLQGQLLAG